MTTALLLLAPAAAAQDARPGEDSANVIAVHGDIPHCHQRAGDPLDEVDVDHAPFRQSVVAADAKGKLGIRPDDDPILGPDVWQRAGTGIADFRFRAPIDGTPFCIGSWGRIPQGWGQLRQVIDAKPTHEKYVRFTAYVATRRSDEVRFWLAAGYKNAPRSGRVLQGGDTSNQPIHGTGSWIPVNLVIGPIDKHADRISYGFLLMGAGDVWVNQPRIEILDEAPRITAMRLSRERRLHPSADTESPK